MLDKYTIIIDDIIASAKKDLNESMRLYDRLLPGYRTQFRGPSDWRLLKIAHGHRMNRIMSGAYLNKYL